MLAAKGKYRVSNLKNSEIEKFCFGLQKQLSTREISINLTKKKKKNFDGLWVRVKQSFAYSHTDI